MIRRTIFVVVSSVVMLISSTTLQAQVATYAAFAVESEAGLVAAIDKWFQSEDARGHSVSLFRAEFDGSTPSSHVLVATFDDYRAYETVTGRRSGSTAWRDLISAVEPILSFLGSGMLISLQQAGEGYDDHDYHVVFSLQVRDVAKYRKAFDKLGESETIKKSPGAVRLWETRAAGGESVTHVAVMTAPGFVEMHEYLDTFLASDDYAKFKDEVGEIRKLIGVSTYRRVGHWSK